QLGGASEGAEPKWPRRSPLGARGIDSGLSTRRRRDNQTRPNANRRLQFHQPRPVVRLPEYVPAQEGICTIARHFGRRRGRAKGGLPATQKDLLARNRPVDNGRGVSRPNVPRES